MRVHQNLLLKLLCVALVAAVMLPMGRMLFPYVSGTLNMMQFQMLEAVASAALGVSLSSLFG
jgi:hypothetical protein